MHHHTACLLRAHFGGIREDIAIGNFFGLRRSGRLIHDCMISTFVDYDVSAETETEVESTSAVSSEVQSHSRNLPPIIYGLKRALVVITGIWWPAIIMITLER